MGLSREVLPVFQKEMVDAIRDRRSLLSALLFPLFAPLMINLLFGAIAARERDARDVDFPIFGMEHAPELVAWIERAGHVVVPVEEDPIESVPVRRGTEDERDPKKPRTVRPDRRGDTHAVLVDSMDAGQDQRRVEDRQRPLGAAGTRVAAQILNPHGDVCTHRNVAYGHSPGEALDWWARI